MPVGVEQKSLNLLWKVRSSQQARQIIDKMRAGLRLDARYLVFPGQFKEQRALIY